MTSTDAMTALITADLASHIARYNAALIDSTAPLDDPTSFCINYDIMRLATAELAASLTQSPNPEFRYYYSDSTYDELNNPATIIHECQLFFDAIYDTDHDALLAIAPRLADNIDYLLNDLDDELTFADIESLAAHIATLTTSPTND